MKLREAVQQALQALGRPKMEYAPSVHLKELERDNEEASDILLQALKDNPANE